MKYKETKPAAAGHGHIHHYFALGYREAEIILGLLNQAKKYTPETPVTRRTLNRMRNMSRAITEALKNWTPQGEEDREA